MTFYDFMMEQFQVNGPGTFDYTAGGDLAYDMYFDKTFPRNSITKSDIKRYLLNVGASYDYLRTFDRCWEIYEGRFLA